jgi:hypothetical protein
VPVLAGRRTRNAMALEPANVRLGLYASFSPGAMPGKWRRWNSRAGASARGIALCHRLSFRSTLLGAFPDTRPCVGGRGGRDFVREHRPGVAGGPPHATTLAPGTCARRDSSGRPLALHTEALKLARSPRPGMAARNESGFRDMRSDFQSRASPYAPRCSSLRACASAWRGEALEIARARARTTARRGGKTPASGTCGDVGYSSVRPTFPPGTLR